MLRFLLLFEIWGANVSINSHHINSKINGEYFDDNSTWGIRTSIYQPISYSSKNFVTPCHFSSPKDRWSWGSHNKFSMSKSCFWSSKEKGTEVSIWLFNSVKWKLWIHLYSHYKKLLSKTSTDCTSNKE